MDINTKQIKVETIKEFAETLDKSFSEIIELFRETESENGIIGLSIAKKVLYEQLKKTVNEI